MIDLSEMATAINHAVADGLACIVGTASKNGEPNVTYKGSVMVYDSQHLAWWEYARKGTVDDLQENPKVTVVYRNPKTHVSWRFYGATEILREGPVREDVMGRTIQAELDHDPERKGYAIMIAVYRVTNGRGETLQALEGSPSQAALSSHLRG